MAFNGQLFFHSLSISLLLAGFPGSVIVITIHPSTEQNEQGLMLLFIIKQKAAQCATYTLSSLHFIRLGCVRQENLKMDLCLASFGNWWAGRPHADSPPIKPAVSPVPGCWGGYCGGLINKAVALRPLCPSKARVPPHLAHYTHFSRCFRCTVRDFRSIRKNLRRFRGTQGVFCRSWFSRTHPLPKSQTGNFCRSHS